MPQSTLVDANVWIALALERHESHRKARQWLDQQLDSNSVLMCRSTQQSFLRLLTTSAVFSVFAASSMTNEAALSVVDLFLDDSRIELISEPAGVEGVWRTLASRTTSSPKLWMDAYLAAFAISGGHRFLTLDQAFTQFKDLDLVLL